MLLWEVENKLSSEKKLSREKKLSSEKKLVLFLASQDALEVMGVTEWVTDWALALTWLMWLWWVMIPIEDFADVNLGSEKTLSSEKS